MCMYMYMHTLHTSTSVHYCTYVHTLYVFYVNTCIHTYCTSTYMYTLCPYSLQAHMYILYVCTYVHTDFVCLYTIQTHTCILYIRTYVCTYTHVDTLSAFHTNACAYCVVPDQLAKVWLLLLQQISHLLYV